MAVEIDVAGTFVTAADLTPAGAIICFGGAAAPSGWLLCNDAAVSRTTYADLFAVIGTTYGVGNGSTTFNVPDMRGIFVRGAGIAGTLTNANGSAFTAVLGTYSNDKGQGHRHISGNLGRNSTAGAGNNMFAGTDAGTGVVAMNDPVTDTTNGTPRTGDETQPANLALSYIIKT